MRIQIVIEGGGPYGLDSQIFEAADVFAAMEVRGYKPDGERCGGGHLREELRGKPQFVGLCGPMWGGNDDDGSPIIRYESWAAYEKLSR